MFKVLLLGAKVPVPKDDHSPVVAPPDIFPFKSAIALSAQTV